MPELNPPGGLLFAEQARPVLEQLQDIMSKAFDNEAASRNKIAILERELDVYRIAYSDTRLKYEDAQKQKEDLENKIKLWQKYRIITLIDGDGAIFSPTLLKRGRAGGQDAARFLTDGILKHLTANYGENQYQLSIYLFLNKRGLMDALGRAGQVAAKNYFDEFLIGFTQAHGRFLVVDVGGDKEAADAKIKTHLEDIELPQTYKVVFGGCHDNGYVANLRSYITNGFRDKLILLKSYSEMAAGIVDLHLPDLTIPDLFAAQKLPSSPRSVPVAPPGLPPPSVAERASDVVPNTYSSIVRAGQRRTLAADEDSISTITNDDSPEQSPTLRPVTGWRRPTPGLALSKHTPAPCTLHYLANCKMGAECRYGHDYLLNEDHLAEMRINAKKGPCPVLNKNEPCFRGDGCLYGHRCPLLPDCYHHKSGNCKFKGADMHKAENNVENGIESKKRW